MATKYSHEHDHYLAAQIAQGNTSAENELYYRMYPRLYRQIRMYKVGDLNTEEIAQITLVKILLKLRSGKYQPRCRLTTWVYKIARNETINFFRRIKYDQHLISISEIFSEEHTQEDWDIPGKYKNPEEIFIEKESVTILKNAIEKLSNIRKDVFTQVAVDRVKYKEYAEQNNIPLVNVKTRLWYARKALQNMPEVRNLRNA